MMWQDRATLLKADYRDTLDACDGAADLVLTSPPYCDARTYGHAVSWTDADYAALGDAVFAALKPGGHALINVDAPVRKWREGFGTERGFHPWRLMLDWAERVGFRVPDRLAFGRQGLPGEYRGRFRNDWEPLLWFAKPGGEPWFDRWAIATDSKHGPVAGKTWKRPADRWPRKKEGTQDPGSQTLGGRAAVEGKTHRGTLWAASNSNSNSQTGCPQLETQRHPARWPYRLARDIVRCFCPPDGLACDPFVGAGTGMIAALDEGRRFIGGDLYERQDDGKPWVDVAAEIAEERYRQQVLFGGLR